MVFETYILYAQHLIVNYSYAAIFLVSVVSSATIFLPVPLIALVFFAAELGLNPLLVGVLSGVGSAIGELTGYLLGAGSEHVIETESKKLKTKSQHKTLQKMDKLFLKYGFPIIFICGILPFPFDFIGIVSGATNYSVKKFMIATILSKVLKYVLIAYAGVLSLPFLQFLYNEVV